MYIYTKNKPEDKWKLFHKEFDNDSGRMTEMLHVELDIFRPEATQYIKLFDPIKEKDLHEPHYIKGSNGRYVKTTLGRKLHA